MIIGGYDVSGWSGATGGGNDPQIINITTLNDRGPGSYRAACEDFGTTPRRAVWKVSGRVNLTSDVVPKSNLTIDAIDDGQDVVITGRRTRLTKDNVIFRGMDFAIGTGGGAPNGDNLDAVSIGSQPNVVSGVFLVQNTLRWTNDEVSGAWGPNNGITYALNVFAEPLRLSLHTKGEHAMGVLIGARDSDPSPSECSVLFNLFAHNDYRNPLIKDGASKIECIGNVIHNYGNSGITISGAQVNLINNIVQRGPDSGGVDRAFRNNAGSNDIYHNGNKVLLNGAFSTLNPDDPARGSLSTSTLAFAGPTTSYPAAGQATLDYVLAYAGHNPNDDHVLRYKQHVLLGVGGIIDAPSEIRDHTGATIKDQFGGSNPTDADAYAWEIPEEFKNGGGGPSGPPAQLEVITGTKGDANVGTPLVITGVDPMKNYRLRIGRKTSKGDSAFSNAITVAANPVSAGATDPNVVGQSSNFQWRFSDIETIERPAGHLSGDYLIAGFSSRENADMTGNSWATFTAGFDGLLTDIAPTGGTTSDMHQCVAYQLATTSPMPGITPRDPGGADTGNLTSSVYVSIRNVSNAPTLLGTSLNRQTGTAITHAGGTVAIGDMVMFWLSAGIDGNNNDQFTSAASCAGIANLTRVGFRSTSATSRAIQTYVWAGIAQQTSVGPFMDTASNSLDWTISATQVPG